MIYKYLQVQIHSSDLFFWVGFIYCVNFFLNKKKLYGPFLWIGFNCVKATEPQWGGTSLYITKLPSILSFRKKLLPTIFQFSCIDSKFWCTIWYHLYNLKTWKTLMQECYFRYRFRLLACNFTKSNTPPLVFLTFLKLYLYN